MRYILILLLVLSALFAGAQQQGIDTLQQKTQVLRRFLELQHYLPVLWDDKASVRLYDRWMELLDADRMLFSKREADELISYRQRLDEELMGKGWAFFRTSVRLYKAGLLRADSLVKAILQKPLDFSHADTLYWPQPAYPGGPDGIYGTWQKYLKWKVLRSISDMAADTSGDPLKHSRQPADFSQREITARERVKKQELQWIKNKLVELELPGKDLEEKYLSAISWCYDPHTDYMSSETKAGFETAMSGLEFSAGFEMDENEKGEWEITYLVPGGPAWRNGELHQGDVVLKVRAGNKAELLLTDATMEQLGRVFDGGIDEKITITVRTVSGTQKIAVLGKEKITNEEGVVKSYILNGTRKIGYITLPGFYVKEGDEDNSNGCSNDVAKEVVKLKKDGVEGLILDLRYNGGGSLGEALELAGIFINEGSLTSTKDKAGKVRFLRDPNRGTIYDGPLLVLVNTMSASAAELVSAVLQDYHRALIVGSTTYGKGSAQVILPMDTSASPTGATSSDSYVKVTHGKFYRVDGSTTQWKGVVPDIELPDMYALDKFREKGTLSALLPDTAKRAIYQALPSIPFGELKNRSNKRVGSDATFNAISKFVTWYRSMDAIRAIPLDWNGYTSYYKKVSEMYRSIELPVTSQNYQLKATNNSLDLQRGQIFTGQSTMVNEINIKRIEKDSYIAESYKIMEDWLR